MQGSVLLPHYRTLEVRPVKGTFKCVTIKRHKQVSASGFPRHPLLSNVYVIEITTRAPRLTLTRKVIRDSVQSSAGLLKVHIFRCFQKISLILCNSNVIFRIMFIIKLQTSCGALTL